LSERAKQSFTAVNLPLSENQVMQTGRHEFKKEHGKSSSKKPRELLAVLFAIAIAFEIIDFMH